MSSTRLVSTTKELKKALDDKVDSIVITDSKLATSVRVINKIPLKTLSAIAVGSGVVVANSWNPLGWIGAGIGGAASAGIVAAAVGAAGITAGTAVVATAAIAVIGGLGLAALVMHNKYDLDTGFALGGSANEGKKTGASASANASGHVRLTRRV